MIILYGVLDKKGNIDFTYWCVLSELGELDPPGVYLVIFEPASDLQTNVVQNVIAMEIVE